MEIRKIRLHTCDQAKEGQLKPEGLIDKKCRCRKFVTLEKASELIDDGVARNVITSYRLVDDEQICSICENLDHLKKSCLECGKTGKVIQSRPVVEYGVDIYMRPFLRTPRTATIEAEHFEYAYINNDKKAQRRIDQYHILDQMSLAKLGASLIDQKTGEILFEGSPEPEDDPDTGTGRRHDYGRTI